MYPGTLHSPIYLILCCPLGGNKKTGEKERNLQLLPGAAGLGYHSVCASGFLGGAEGIWPGGFSEYRGNSTDLVCGWRGILSIAEGNPGPGGLVSCGPAGLWRLPDCCSSCRRSWDKAAKKGTGEQGWSVTINGATVNITCWDWTKPNSRPGPHSFICKDWRTQTNGIFKMTMEQRLLALICLHKVTVLIACFLSWLLGPT